MGCVQWTYPSRAVQLRVVVPQVGLYLKKMHWWASCFIFRLGKLFRLSRTMLQHNMSISKSRIYKILQHHLGQFSSNFLTVVTKNTNFVVTLSLGRLSIIRMPIIVKWKCHSGNAASCLNSWSHWSSYRTLCLHIFSATLNGYKTQQTGQIDRFRPSNFPRSAM